MLLKETLIFQDVLFFDIFQRIYLILFYFHSNQLRNVPAKTFRLLKGIIKWLFWRAVRNVKSSDLIGSWAVSNLPFRTADNGNVRNKIKICQLWNKMANNFRTTLWWYTSCMYVVRNFISFRLKYNSHFCNNYNYTIIIISIIHTF